MEGPAIGWQLGHCLRCLQASNTVTSWRLWRRRGWQRSDEGWRGRSKQRLFNRLPPPETGEPEGLSAVSQEQIPASAHPSAAWSPEPLNVDPAILGHQSGRTARNQNEVGQNTSKHSGEVHPSREARVARPREKDKKAPIRHYYPALVMAYGEPARSE